MKIFSFILTLFICSSLSLGFAKNDYILAVKTFNKDLYKVKSKLISGKINSLEARILLQAIEVRQNNVIISQNAEVLKILKDKLKI